MGEPLIRLGTSAFAAAGWEGAFYSSGVAVSRIGYNVTVRKSREQCRASRSERTEAILHFYGTQETAFDRS
jgi:hypothetical protein